MTDDTLETFWLRYLVCYIFFLNFKILIEGNQKPTYWICWGFGGVWFFFLINVSHWEWLNFCACFFQAEILLNWKCYIHFPSEIHVQWNKTYKLYCILNRAAEIIFFQSYDNLSFGYFFMLIEMTSKFQGFPYKISVLRTGSVILPAMKYSQMCFSMFLEMKIH